MQGEIVQATSPADVRDTRELLLEYASSLGFSLCFQSFDKELAGLPGEYGPPEGMLLLARMGSIPAGCVALRKLEADTCEMKRLYVRPQFRGTGLGDELTHRILQSARTLGYARMRLDTIATTMQAAVRLYRKLGFAEVPPYRENPIPDAIFLELNLKNFEAAAASGSSGRWR
ncbi:MAG TPA: GNAT family N-acetyltransferase [Terriglobales bacterium]